MCNRTSWKKLKLAQRIGWLGHHESDGQNLEVRVKPDQKSVVRKYLPIVRIKHAPVVVSMNGENFSPEHQKRCFLQSFGVNC